VTVGADYVVLFMADVSGQGESSACVTVLLKNLTARMRSEYNRKQRQTVLNPDEFLAKANAELLGTQLGKHATVFFAVVDMQSNTLRYSVAGQLPLPLLVCDQVARYLDGSGPPIGLFEDTDYQVKEVSLPDQFRIMMFSDGILEALPQESLVQKEQFLLEQAAGLSTNLDEALTQLGVDVNTAYPDDIALLVLDKE
ncbi:serine/threonine-protein phosphatase, partial [bacterium]|nr:serine/threonine-protein phosphatase [bacterium]